MRDRIYITEADYERLSKLVEGRLGGGADNAGLAMLEQELDRAEIVQAGDIPKDVITMNSEVRLKDCDSGEELVYRLIFPTQVRGQNTISVLAPIGTAILGYRVGDTIEWRVPKGLRRLEVIEILHQPESSALLAS